MLEDEKLVALEVEVADHIATVTLLGPSKGNAMGPDFWRELPIVFRAIDADEDVRAVVLTGSGKNFSYGLDLPAMAPNFAPLLADGALAKARTEFLAHLRGLQDSVNAVAECRKPIVAAIAGWCIGGGVDVITATDIRLSTVDAKFSVREVKVAIVADLGSLQRLSGIIGEGHLRELALTGKDIDGAYAEKIGLVNHTYADQDALLTAARELATQLAANPPLVVRGIKDVLDVNRGPQVAAGLRYVGAWNAAFLPSRDLTEAIQSFVERRSPHFTGE